MSALNQPRFQNAESAREFLEALRWPQGPICPHCGVVGGHYSLTGKSTRPGLWKCKDCREQFSVTVGTVFERSKIGLHIWLQAAYLMTSSKKGMSAHQLHRTLGVTYKTAWFMAHRIREAMTGTPTGQLGGGGKTVEADETYYGNIPGKPIRGGSKKHKNKIMALVERDGDVRAFHVAEVDGRNVREVIKAQIARKTHLMTDEAHVYKALGRDFRHSTVNHSIYEFARGEVSTNTVEGYFSILKRGLTGIYQHVSEKHLQRYVEEFSFRYNHRQSQGVNDEMCAIAALKGIEGKRLTYRRTNESAA